MSTKALETRMRLLSVHEKDGQDGSNSRISKAAGSKPQAITSEIAPENGTKSNSLRRARTPLSDMSSQTHNAVPKAEATSTKKQSIASQPSHTKDSQVASRPRHPLSVVSQPPDVAVETEEHRVGGSDTKQQGAHAKGPAQTGEPV